MIDELREALAILRRTPDIDVLFSDVVMPGMSGVELAQQARRIWPGLRIILASGYTALGSAEAQSSGEQFQRIAKPYSIAQILRQLR